jgi:hypothetical protein
MAWVQRSGVGGRDDVAVAVLGDGQQPVQVFEVGLFGSDRAGQARVRVEPELGGAHQSADRGELAQHPPDRHGVPGGEQVRQVFRRDAQRIDGGEDAVGICVVRLIRVRHVGDGGQGRDIPDHRQGAVLRVQRQRHLVPDRQRVHRGPPGRVDPVRGDALSRGLAGDGWVGRVEEHRQLRLIQVLRSEVAAAASTLSAS